MQNESSITPFEEDFEEYQISIADKNACKHCKVMRDKKFSIKDRKAGVNLPPFHCWCRCSFTITVDEWDKWMDDYVEKHGKEPENAVKSVAKSGESGIINLEDKTRNMANGLRTPANHILTDEEILSLKSDIKAIGADETVFRFNAGRYTGYNDDGDFINVRGDVLPDKTSNHPRDLMSQRAVITHEYYGHRANRNTKLPKGAWNDEFRASYMAARNCPNLSNEDKRYLIMDALERARESGVAIKHNDFIRRILYGY